MWSIERAVAGDAHARAALFSDLAAWRSARDPRFNRVVDEIAAAAAGGSEPALELILEIVHRLGLARPAIARVLLQTDQIDEVAQEVLVSLARGMDTFAGTAAFTTWLTSVARNHAFMHVRAGTRRPPLDAGDRALIDEIPDRARGMSSAIATRRTVEEAIDALPSPYRETIQLQLGQQLEYEELAARLGVPVGTVRSRLARARALLLESLGSDGR